MPLGPQRVTPSIANAYANHPVFRELRENASHIEPLAKFSDVVEKKQNGLILFGERAPRS